MIEGSNNVGSAVKKRCFVISPIGEAGSEMRQHADDIFDFIIQPAMQECGIIAIRSDHVDHPGRITDQMFRALLQADLCVALVTYDNPNVFYELAIAHAASRPVIILNRKGHKLPFDIQDARCVEYEYLPRPLAKGDYAKMVSQHINNLKATGWQAPDFLGTYGLPMGEKYSGVTTFLAKASEFETIGGWEAALQHVHSTFDIAGMSLAHWRNIKGFAEQLGKLGREGCRARVLIIDPMHPLLTYCFNPALREMIPSQVVAEISAMVEFYQQIAADSPNIQVRIMRKAICTSELTLNDEEALSSLYLYSDRPCDAPLWGCRKGSRLYSALAQEFSAHWDANAP